MITQRQNDILNLIVDLFTQTKEPVGSKRLQEVIDTSSATIRNDMARLEKLGLLEKAHTSSGRKPSLAGFKYFVQHSLSLDRIDEQDAYQVIKAFDFEAFKLEDLLKTASQVLADLTGYTAIVLDVEAKQQHLTGFKIVQHSSHDALAILVLDESRPVTVQFAIPKNFLSKDLLVLEELISERLLGKSVLDIHYKLRTEIPQVVQKYFVTTDNVLDLFDYIFVELFKETIFIAGKVNSLNYGGLPTYQFLDNPQEVALILRQETQNQDLLKVDIVENFGHGTEQIGLINQPFLIPYRGFGLLSLIGPVDMDYRRAVSLTNLVSKVLAAKLTDYYRYLNSNHYEVEKGDDYVR